MQEKDFTTRFRPTGEPELDASLLVMPIVGYCDPRSPRFESTRDTIIEKLGRNDLIHRYRPGIGDEPEGAFTICNFWLADALAMAGRASEASRWFEGVIRHLPPSGLAAEEINPETGEQLGNFPQAFSHIGLINAALAISAARERIAA